MIEATAEEEQKEREEKVKKIEKKLALEEEAKTK